MGGWPQKLLKYVLLTYLRLQNNNFVFLLEHILVQSGTYYFVGTWVPGGAFED